MTNGEADYWSVFENRIANMLSEREEAQAQIDASMQRDDFFGASMGSFRHALASLELDDRIDFRVHIMMAMALAEADIVLEAEAAQLDPLDMDADLPLTPVKVFEVPEFFRQEPELYWTRHVSDDEKVIAARYEAEAMHYERVGLNQAVVHSVDNAESLLAMDTVFDESEQNFALLDAIAATTNFISSDLSASYHYNNEKFEALKLAQQLAASLHLNGDFESTQYAFRAYELLMHTTLRIEGRTLSVHNQMLKAFEDIAQGIGKEELGEQCLKHIKTIELARLQIIGRAIILPAKWIANDYYITGAASPTKGAKTRPSLAMQRHAIHAYKTLLEQYSQHDPNREQLIA